MAIKPISILINAKDQASGVLDLLRQNAKKVGAAIVAYFGFRSFLGAINGAAELEGKLSEVQAVSGATADEMVRLRKAAEDAGATTRYTATEAAGALGNLSRAGLDANQSISALPGTLALAQAGNIGLEESASIVTKTLAGFGLEAEKSGQVADVLAKGANSANTNVLGLAQALSYAAPTAQSLGLSMETTVAIIGKFADAGIDASRAGTALNAILAQFSDPASRFRQELAAIGITTNDFEEALRQMAAAGPGAQKALLAVGTEAGPAIRAFLNQGIGAFDELKTKLLDAEGAAKATADTMENNLQGAARGLGSAWDTVKNALATPVLPVLKDGITQLAGALRSAVSDGTVGRFGSAIASGFQAALTWARAFISEVDFAALAERAGSAADRVGAAFDSLAEKATNAGNIASTIWGVMTAGVNGVMSVVYTVGEAFAGVASNIQSGIALILQGLSRITFGDVSKSFSAAAEEMRISAEATWASSEALAQKARESFIGMADGAELARSGWAGLTGQTQEAAAQARASEKVFEQLGETLKETGGDAEAVGMKARAAAAMQTAAARQVRVEVENLKREYEAALKAGDVQTAVSKLQQMQSALGQTRREASVTAAEVANAFERMGIRTKDELAQAAANARRDFDLIRQSGQATAEGLQTAFRTYAEAAIGANGGVASESLKAEAAMRGLQITTDAAGRSIVQAMTEASTATGQLGDAAGSAAGQFRVLASAADSAAAAAARVAEMSRRYSRPGEGSTDPKDPGRGSPYARPQDAKPVNSDGQTQEEYLRAEKLKGQNAVDNTLAFALRDKLRTGTLTPEDADSIRAVISALDQNEAINRDLDRLNPAAFSLEGAADRNEWRNVRQQLAQQLARLGGQQAPAVGRTVQVRIDTGRGTETVNTDDAGAQAIVRSLQQAAMRAGR